MKKLITYKTENTTVEFTAEAVDALEVCQAVQVHAKENGIDFEKIKSIKYVMAQSDENI